MPLRNQMKFRIVYFESQWYPPSVHNKNFYQMYSETLKMPNFPYLLTHPRGVVFPTSECSLMCNLTYSIVVFILHLGAH